MKVIGITGGIGMGKSTAAELLAGLGIVVTDTDQIARNESNPGTEAFGEICRAFGNAVLEPEGTLSRKRLAELVFGNEAARRVLEAILHPRIAIAWRRQLAEWREQGHAYAAVIIPLLFERNYSSEFEATVCLACSAPTQQRRLAQRGWSDEQIRARKAAQLPIEDKMNRSKFVIWTEGSLEAHARQWDRVLAAL